jgi:ribosomal protein L24
MSCEGLANKLASELNCEASALPEDELKNVVGGKVVDCVIVLECNNKKLTLVIEECETAQQKEVRQAVEFVKQVGNALGSNVLILIHHTKRSKLKRVGKPKVGRVNLLGAELARCEQGVMSKVKRLFGRERSGTNNR